VKQKHEALTDNTQLNPSSSALQLRSTTDSQMTKSDLKSFSPGNIIAFKYPELSDSPKIKIGKITQIGSEDFQVIDADVDTRIRKTKKKFSYRFPQTTRKEPYSTWKNFGYCKNYSQQ